MKTKSVLMVLLLGIVISMFTSCTSVPVGYGGVEVVSYGSDKGVQDKPLGVGRYWLGWYTNLYQFPIYQVNYTYTRDTTEGSKTNEEFTFQTKEGMLCSMDLGLGMQFLFDDLPAMYTKYHKGEEEIRGVVVRNAIRDKLNRIAGKMPVEQVYGEGKAALVDTLNKEVKKYFEKTGIEIANIYLIGEIRIPNAVKTALESKVKMTQQAQEKENQLRMTKADSAITITNAKAKAYENEIISKSITPTLINWTMINKWDSKLPQVTSGGNPFLNLSLK